MASNPEKRLETEKDVVLHKRSGHVGDVYRKIAGLTLAGPEILLTVLGNHLYEPFHGVNPATFRKFRDIGKVYAASGTFSTGNIDLYLNILEHVDDTIAASVLAPVLHTRSLV